MRLTIKIVITFFIVAINLPAQDKEITKLIDGELKMTFPSVYFKHGSEDYASMPYTADSCFKYIARNYDKNINSLVIWRDSTEPEKLTNKRTKKLTAGLNKYLKSGKIEIHSMGREQKISRRTINAISDSTQVAYLLSLNSVFDFSKTQVLNAFSKNDSHILHPKIWCGKCWLNCFHLNRRGREARKMMRKSKANQRAMGESYKRGSRRHLVWTGWKTGFHWSTSG